jgi:hypothetical protein
MLDAYDLLGLLGVAINLYAYARVQLQREYAKRLGYSLANLLGAVLLAASLLSKWNFAAFTGNVIWAILSFFGLYRCVKYIRRDRDMAVSGNLAETGPSGG